MKDLKHQKLCIFAHMEALSILYVGDPGSFHDLKWVKYFTMEKNYKAVFVCERQPTEIERERLRLINIHNIYIVAPYSQFNFIQNKRTLKFYKELVAEHNITHCHVFIGIAHAIIPSKLKVNKLLTTRGTDVLVTLPGLFKGGVRAKMLAQTLRAAYMCYDWITSTSETQRVSIKQWIPEVSNQNILVRTGVDLKAAQAAKAKLPRGVVSDKTIILFPRGLKKLYNPVLHASALKFLPSEILNKYDFVFLEAAGVDKEEWAKAKVILDGVDGLNYHVVGRLEQQDLWALIQYAELVVMCPESDGTPNSGIECMTTKTKLILGNCKYDSAIFNEETALFLKDYDPEKLAQLMQQALNSYSNERLQKAFEVVQQEADWQNQMEKIVTLYNSSSSLKSS